MQRAPNKVQTVEAPGSRAGLSRTSYSGTLMGPPSQQVTQVPCYDVSSSTTHSSGSSSCHHLPIQIPSRIQVLKQSFPSSHLTATISNRHKPLTLFKMLRPVFTKTAAIRPLRATFTTTARAMAAGDTGAPPKTGGPG